MGSGVLPLYSCAPGLERAAETASSLGNCLQEKGGGPQTAPQRHNLPSAGPGRPHPTSVGLLERALKRTPAARPSYVLKFKRGELRAVLRRWQSGRGRSEVAGAALPSRANRRFPGGVEPVANRGGVDLKVSDPFLRPHNGYGAVVRGGADPSRRHWGKAAPGRHGTWGSALRRPLVVGAL